MEPLTLTRRAACGGALALATGPALARRVPRVLTGLDRLASGDVGTLAGQRIGLLTHDAAVAADGRRSVDVIAGLRGVTLAALFAPEHGLAGGAAAGEHVGDRRDTRTGLPIYSLYGARTAPEPAQLAGIDWLVVDLQDAGLRCYTYAGTAMAAIRAAQVAGLRTLVLDRPNPLGAAVEGPMLDPALPLTPVTALPVPYRHGMTLGELARLLVGRNVEVAAMQGWRRADGTAVFGSGRLPFVTPSPNLRSPAAMLAYAATVLIEGTNLSEGRGTAAPFQQVGAPWLIAAPVVAALKRAGLPGVHVAPTAFTPAASKHAGSRCQGIAMTVTDERRFNGFATGLALIAAIRAAHPDRFAFLPGKPPFFDLLAGAGAVRQGLEAGRSLAAILADTAIGPAGYARRDVYLY
ncbi:exo-beta-N-acetylmuramidase NamZ family protein [Parablastomonas sp. CN1-191]|uniref:exo-beta-N-acetylmuramidase NamZ family protein n=1 Tax=Parablastomonas sp. CN1-191 TaxID=3400908 RepID=UPI003BF7B50C